MMQKKHVVILLCIGIYMHSLSAMDSLIDKICTTESVIDIVTTDVVSLESNICQLSENVLSVESTFDSIDFLIALSKACTVESIVDDIYQETLTIESNIDNQNSILDDIESVVEVLDDNVFTIHATLCTIDSKVDVVNNSFITIESIIDTLSVIDNKIDTIDEESITLESKLCFIDSLIDGVIDQTTTIKSTLDIVASDIDCVDSRLDFVSLEITTIQSHLDLVENQLVDLFAEAQSVESKVCIIDSQADIVSSNVDYIKDIANVVIDKAEIIEYDFVQTWTVLAQIENDICNLESNADYVSSILDSTEIRLDDSGTFTVIEAIYEKSCTADSLIDAIQKKINLTNALSIISSFTLQNDILDKLCTTNSQIDELIETTTVLQPLQDCLGTPIRQSDIGTTGYTISSRGRYYLAENIIFAPSSGIPAISIAADNVYLDLNGKTMSMGNNQTGVVGIITSGARDNITIRNGSLKGFTGDGIQVPTTASITNMILDGLLLENIGEALGIAEGADGIDISNGVGIVISNSVISRSEDENIDLNNCTDVLIINCSLIESKSSHGITCDGSLSRIRIKSCDIYGNFGSGVNFTLTTAATQVGHLIEDCNIIENGNSGISTFSNNTTTSVQNIVIKNNIINNNNNYGVKISVSNSNRWVIVNNSISYNGIAGIFFSTLNDNGNANTLIRNNVILFNTFNNNGIYNIREAGLGPNTVLGNFAFHSNGDSANYSFAGLTVITGAKSVISQTGAFPGTLPTYWYNISMTP